MIGRINHIAIAVPDVEKAATYWQEALGADVSGVESLPEHGVRIVFVDAPNGKVELMEPLGAKSPIAALSRLMMHRLLQHFWPVTQMAACIIFVMRCRILLSLVII